jgi:hypothetical protein
VWPIGGLETGAAVLLSSLAALAVTARPTPRPLAAGASLAALAWLRPELAVFGCVMLFGLLLRDRRKGWQAIGLAALGAAALVAARIGCFGDPLPLSFHAKPAELAHGVAYVLRWLVIGTSVVGLVLAGYGAAKGRGSDRLLLAGLVAHIAAVALAGGDWMPGFRLMVPLLPVYIVLAALGATHVWRRRRWLAPGLLLLACALPAVDLATRIGELRSAGHARETAGRRLADWLAANARRVALVDIGYLALTSGVEVIDLGGITDPVVAHLPGGHLDKRVTQDLLRRRAPDAIVLHSRNPARQVGKRVVIDGYPVENRVAAMPWVQAHFRLVSSVRYAPGYHYAVLARQGPRSGRGR